ncbi:tyrosine-type recombinase/integrase [Rhodovulum imhoffii]|uniref:tyrosine-type recombinase/integrase n=1 Tax=Rhodovulum imhoffii TaxID=365340 RepID=UPI000D3DB414|nr:tyrosine-type recombinase/integrase [Rhodovulum imhoffii]MBK5933181.1 hypothetical protein [Rhodovulum imhoffii]
MDCYLPGAYGSAEFRAAYEAAVEGARVPVARAAPGTVAFLIETYLASSAYADLAAKTKSTKRGRLDWIKTAIGEAKYADLLPRHVEALMDKKGGPEAANRCKKDLAQLYELAAKRFGFRGQNPAKLADSRKTRKGGFHTWTDAEIAQFRDHFESGTQARLAFEVFLGTGAARQDAAALTRANIRGGRLSYRRGKTGQEVDLPILPELARELAHVASTQMVLIGHGDGQAYRPESLGNWFRDRCVEAGLPHCTPHGLRKAGARRLAEHGATEWEVMAFLAHGTAKEASRYVAAANRAKLTTSGLARLRVKKEQN